MELIVVIMIFKITVDHYSVIAILMLNVVKGTMIEFNNYNKQKGAYKKKSPLLRIHKYEWNVKCKYQRVII